SGRGLAGSGRSIRAARAGSRVRARLFTAVVSATRLSHAGVGRHRVLGRRWRYAHRLVRDDGRSARESALGLVLLLWFRSISAAWISRHCARHGIKPYAGRRRRARDIGRWSIWTEAPHPAFPAALGPHAPAVADQRARGPGQHVG